MGDISPALEHATAFMPPLRPAAASAIPNMLAYRALVDEAEHDHRSFWARHAREQLDWQQPFTTVLDDSAAPFYRWFEDGKLNASYNCLDRHVQAGRGGHIAIVFEADDGTCTQVTYLELLARVCQFANVLKSRGIGRGDRVVIYMPMSIEAVVAMQACARLGAIHAVVFGGFSAKALHERIVDVGAVAVVTADEQIRAGKTLPLKAMIDQALSMGDTGKVGTVLVYRRTQGEVAWDASRDVCWHTALSMESTECEPEWVGAEDPLFILYTSGSTGKPKGVQHSTGGYLLWAALTMRWTFDVRPTDVFWCTADIGWITGHTYLCYGPMLTGTTQVVFEGVPTYPRADRFWQVIQRHHVSIFYTAPTAIRSLMKATDADPIVHPARFNLSSLRILGSVGEPINPSAWRWYYEHVGASRCPVLDTFWQTESGGHLITPLPGVTPLVPGSCTLPLPGIAAVIVDETGNELPDGESGLLAVKRPWPSMLRTVWGDAPRFKASYFPDELGGTTYLAGDGAVRDPETGYFTITGRIDDVLNVSGHRMGTMEIEAALAAHGRVAEAAVVGRPDETTGEAIVAFVVLKDSAPVGEAAQQIAAELRAWVAKQIGPIARPKEMRFGESLPKTRSGKVMRRLLRALASNTPIAQDTSTLENPAMLEHFRDVS
jgi:acetyl-CoA synthetase